MIELVVYSALLVFLLGGVYLLVVSGLRYFQTGTAYQTTQQQALIALRKIDRELVNSTDIRRIYANDHVIFLSPEPLTTDPPAPFFHDGVSQHYRKWVCVYHDPGSQELRRVEDNTGFTVPDGESSAAAPDPPSLAAFQAVPSPPVLARGITFFQVAPGANQDILQIAIYAQDQTGGSTANQPRFTEVRLQTDIRMLND